MLAINRAADILLSSERPPEQLRVPEQVPGRLISLSAIFARKDLVFPAHEFGNRLRPPIERVQNLGIPDRILGLILVVFLSSAELAVRPQRIGDFDSPVTALPNEWRIAVANRG